MLYTMDDYHANRCSLDDVGTEIPLPSTDELNMAELIKGAYNAAGGREAFEAEARKNPAALFNAVLKMGVAQAAKQETTPLPPLDALTDAEIEAMSSLDLKRLLLREAGITSREQLT